MGQKGENQLTARCGSLEFAVGETKPAEPAEELQEERPKLDLDV